MRGTDIKHIDTISVSSQLVITHKVNKIQNGNNINEIVLLYSKIYGFDMKKSIKSPDCKNNIDSMTKK